MNALIRYDRFVRLPRLLAALVVVAAALVASPAGAVLNEFSLADGYVSPFSTRVWTYNPLRSFDGGSTNGNYVAQHEYNSGFAINEPFALVVRNDNVAGNYRFSYDFVAAPRRPRASRSHLATRII